MSADEFNAMSKLASALYYGYKPDDETESFRRSAELTDSPEGLAYANILIDIYKKSHELTSVFPEGYGHAVDTGLRFLIASSLYAISEHRRHGNKTDVKLPLNENPDVLDLSLRGQEPLELLSALNEALSRIIQAREHGEVTLANVGSEFKIFRFLERDEIGELTNTVSVYIRPRGAETFDGEYEYGRNGEGVEASISFVVDPVSDGHQLIELGRHKGIDADNRISIRLDREGISNEDRGNPAIKRDPTQVHGTLSLDVGYILGNKNSLSTRLGRFLAWGNLIRSQTTGDKVTLNHVTDYFTSYHGSADTFEREANSLMSSLESKRIDTARISGLHLGRVALVS
jgi:hypothetical protein